MLDSGLKIIVQDKSAHIDLRMSMIEEPDLVHDLIYINSGELIDSAMSVGRSDSWIKNLISPIRLFIRPLTLEVNAEIDEQDIEDQIKDAFGDLETPSQPADYNIEFSDDTLVYFVPGINGEELGIENAINKLREDTKNLELESLKIELVTIIDEMTSEDALSLTPKIIDALEHAPYYLTYTSETYREYWWAIDEYDLADWFAPEYVLNEDHELVAELILSGDAYDEFLESVSESINIDPVNAKFSMSNGVVTEFKGSQDGIEFDPETTIQELMDELGNEDVIIDIAVASTPPEISIADVNDFGITEILGVGTSDFSGSPSNRISNIQHGASKLNGLLIAPGETVSLIDELGPFTISDGYLAELVIKGDEIKPEVGGGLCQIGTTTFRAVMNSGLQIDERRNHSLVVSYYNDPNNGNPGTDATIYDPYPDFKFTNDYKNYILLTTYVDVPNRELYFTFWGTNDGRNGYYSAPVVLSWAGYGEAQYTETLDLDPGVEQCQYPHSGATAQFTYYVDYADDTTFSETYTSVYRSLPKICLIGVEELIEVVECEEGEECEQVVIPSQAEGSLESEEAASEE